MPMPPEPIADPLRAAATSAPEALALVAPGRTWTFADLDAAADAAAVRLKGLELTEGARFALYGTEPAETLVLLLAALRTGAVAAPLSNRLPPEAVPPLLRHVAARALVTPALPVVLPKAIPAYEPALLLAREPGAADLLAHYAPASRHVSAGQPLTIVFTSGSAGAPKAALHSVGNHVYSALGSNANIALGPGDRWLLSLPLYHVGGLAVLFRCLVAGATIVVPPTGAPLAETLARDGITHVSLVSTQLMRLLQQEAPGLGRLKAILLGGSAIPPGLLDDAVRRGLPVHTSYGLTEMASQVTTTPPGTGRDALRSSGRLLPNREIKLAGDGEILVRGRTRFLGYAEGDRLVEPFDADGWFATRDLGRLEDGWLTVEGRKDNLFISGGENVQPEEVEAALAALPEVLEAVVVPVADAEFGQRPVAFVRTVMGAVPDHLQDDLRARLAPVLPRFKIPDAVYPWPDDAPAGLKVDRRAFAARAARRGG